MKSILITGANSYIGESVSKYLRHDENRYMIQVKDTVGWKPSPADFKYIDVVFNVVGIAHTIETTKNRHLYYDVNRDLVINIAKNAKIGGVKQFILLSSMSVYGMEIGEIFKTTKAHPNSAYGKSKLQADQVIKKMEEDSFIFTCLRPPMVYGKGCKGNYQLLKNFALKSPIFPDYNNKRSMIYIGNLCEFVKKCIDEKKSGLFFPQNAEYTITSEMVRLIAAEHGKRIRLTKVFNPVIRTASNKVIKKVFGSLIYEPVDRINKFNFEESIRLTEE